MRARLKPLLSWLLLWLVAAYWPGQAKQAAAQSLTINGKTATTATVGDTLKLVYTFLQGMQVGFGEVWLDLDGDSTLSQGDQLLYQTIWEEDMLIDGEANDEDGAVDGKFETTITDFIWLAPAGFVFMVTDGVTQTEAYLELLPLTNGPTIEGEVTLPRNVKDLVVFVTPIMGDGPPDGGDQPPFSGKVGSGSFSAALSAAGFPRSISTILGGHDQMAPCFVGPDTTAFPDPDKMEKFFFGTLTDTLGKFKLVLPPMAPPELMLFSEDWAGMLSDYFPPRPQPVRLGTQPGQTPYVKLAYDQVSSVVTGKVVDQNGKLLSNAYGFPVEVTVVAASPVSKAANSARTMDGEFSIPVYAGDWIVDAPEPIPGYLHKKPTRVSVGINDTAKVTIEMATIDETISGYVTVNDTMPLGCARIWGMSASGYVSQTFTDDNGYYELDVSTIDSTWYVQLDMSSVPPGLIPDSTIRREATVGDTDVDFNLVRGDTTSPDEPPHPVDDDFEIISVQDIPNDQGLQVRVIWKASRFDRNQGESNHDPYGNYYPEVKKYGVWRRGPEVKVPEPDSSAQGGNGGGKAVQTVASFEELLRAAEKAAPGSAFRVAGTPYVWDFIATVPAARMRAYAYVAPTLHDSTAKNPGWSVFMISAHTEGNGRIFFTSPDSGYSVDNLAPNVANVQARLVNNGVELKWETPNTPDLVHARIYKGSTENFSIKQGKLIGVTEERKFFDASGDANTYYRIVVTDDAGNTRVSDAVRVRVSSVLVQDETSGIPSDFVLDQNYPNPFNPSTTIQFGVPRPSQVRLEIYDLRGRRVKTLVDQEVNAGYYKVLWDGRNEFGQKVSTGLYFFKLQTPDRLLQRKMILSK